MNNPATNISDIVNDKNNLSKEDSDVVDSIINDLNKTSNDTYQEKMPHITDEEREVIMKQKELQDKEKAQYHVQQQQKEIQNQQMKQQEEMINMYSKMNQNIPLEEKIKDVIFKSLDIIIVLFLCIVFNTSSFSEFLKFKSVPLLYNIETETSTTASIILKSLLIAISFGIIKYFTK